MNIDVVVCTYRRFDVLDEAVRSLLNQSMDKKRYRVIIVDNSGQPDESERFWKMYSHFPTIEYIIELEPGLSRARNIGWKESRAEIVAYMDDDAVADQHWLASLLETYQMDDRVQAVGGKVAPIWPCPRPGWLHDYMLGFLSVVDWEGETVREAAANEWLAGTNISFSREILIKKNGFDEKLGRRRGALLSNEDIEIINSIRESNGLIMYNPKALVKHLVDPERLTQDWFRRRVFWQSVSDLLAQDSENTADHVWEGVTRYFNSLEPLHRTPAGFFINPLSADDFQMQLDAIYSLAKMIGLGRPCPATKYT